MKISFFPGCFIFHIIVIINKNIWTIMYMYVHQQKVN